MKNIFFFSFLLCSASLLGQAIDPARSAKAAADADMRFIAACIAFHDEMIFLYKKGNERGSVAEVKELAQQLEEDHSGLLYSMEQLQIAGKGASSGQAKPEPLDPNRPAALVSTKLAVASGRNFDTTWLAGMLSLEQAKVEEFTQAKETVTNPQIKMALTAALPVMRKHVSQLRSLYKNTTRIMIQEKKEAERLQKQKK